MVDLKYQIDVNGKMLTKIDAVVQKTRKANSKMEDMIAKLDRKLDKRAAELTEVSTDIAIN